MWREARRFQGERRARWTTAAGRELGTPNLVVNALASRLPGNRKVSAEGPVSPGSLVASLDTCLKSARLDGMSARPLEFREREI